MYDFTQIKRETYGRFATILFYNSSNLVIWDKLVFLSLRILQRNILLLGIRQTTLNQMFLNKL